MFHDIIIVGGGASGLVAAIVAKDRGLDVAIVEGNDRIGKKILTTGNGRCNITNTCVNNLKYYSNNTNFFKSIIESFNLNNTIEFFNSLGLPLVELEDGKIYPMSLQASSVLDIFRMAIDERNIPLYLNSKINKIQKLNNTYKLFTSEDISFTCNKLILSCGGASAPATGSDGSGFLLAKSLGHELISPVPGLVQLKLKHDKLKALSGIKFDGTSKIFINDELIREEYGEILFTDYGISGPPILQVSSIISRALYEKNKVVISIDINPNTTKEQLSFFLENHWGTFSYRSLHDSLIGIVNKKLIPILLKECSISDIHKPCYQLSWKEKNSIISLLKKWNFAVYDTNSFKNSQITCGGVDTKNIDPYTLQSKIVQNLFFTGEILDVHGDCGGYNLQWAWSSGYIVGTNI
ncbi:NAD(P)/FAD-dependent oxidoreductase [uncultured Clostridium sp.]|uniref:NAD(P)/FAD-dependent oxidoreductase n=1 Tax=uncultured Clostridium sp. TaxID=59620 RepID=UPI0028E5B669|nr:NAD(P)/FAD-dependent oxidoreductase [uncultured Clostridium sp.]